MRVTCCSTAPMRQVLNPVGFPTIMVMFNERIRNYKGPVPAHGWRVRRRFRPLWPRLSRVSRCFRCLTASPGRAVGSWSWRVLDGRGIYAHPRGEARPRVHLRYRSAAAMTSDYVPRAKWLEGRPTRTGKGGSGGVAQPIAALEKLPSTVIIDSMRISQRCFH